MKINFDEWNERRNTNCGKWDTMDKKYQKEGMLHLGVADMDFRSPKQIIDAFQDILDKGIFGYTDLSDRFYENIRQWMKQKHQAEVAREEIVFCPRINVSSKDLCGNIYRRNGRSDHQYACLWAFVSGCCKESP